MATQDYRTIVVGTDGSALAAPTVTRAARIAAAAAAGLVIVCAWEGVGAHAGAMFAGAARTEGRCGAALGRQAGRHALQQALRVASVERASVREALLVESDAAEALLRIAAARDAELIVLGSPPQATVAERLLGTVAADVGKRAECDVLLVRTRTANASDAGAAAPGLPELVTETITLPDA